ncbi:MAG: lipoyl synthase [Aquificota bacterium]|nr:lipoyl synthase [Aquificota bacterium]
MHNKPVIRLSETHGLKRILREAMLNTVCEESRCPNISECFSEGTATFMILGDRCTRSCSFCNVRRGKPLPPDPFEPYRILEAVKVLRLRYVVITSVTRDDLPDGGASQFASCVKTLKENIPGIKVEVLIPDFCGSRSSLEVVLAEGPDVVAHNVETVPRLYSSVRGGADYRRSLEVLRTVKEIKGDVITKSALILGFGERKDEVIKVLEDLREAGCDVLTVGQYYQPSLRHHPVVKYYSQEEFDEIREIAYSMGFKFVASGPNVRSSYRAFEQWMSCRA